MSKIIKTYLLQTDYTTYNVQITYYGVQLKSTKIASEADEIKYLYLYDNARCYDIHLGGTEYCSNTSVFKKIQ